MPTKRALKLLVGLLFGMEECVERPVFNRLECADLALAFHDQAHCDGLHAAGGESAAHLVPQQRRNLVADQPVEHAACLLRVDEILIDFAGMLECFLHGLLRDLVEGDAANLLASLWAMVPSWIAR